MSLVSPPDSQRRALFQRLKPLCISVSDHALRIRPTTTAHDLQQSLVALYNALLAVDDRTLLTPAMADYVFFPLSHILKRKNEWTDRILELTLGCIRILLESAWSTGLAVQMFEQFCLMLVVITEGKSKRISEEVKAASVSCLLSLFRSAQRSMENDETLRETIRGSKLRPLMGHTATVLLDVVRDEALLALRIDAAEALSLLYVSLLVNGQTVAGFLPLTVSTISRSLSSSPSTTNHRLLVSLLSLLQNTLSLVMDDSLKPTSRSPSVAEMYYTDMSDSWYRATKGQVKIALESFYPAMRIHSHHIVRESIVALSKELICHCSRTLDVCQSLFLETILSLMHDDFPSVQQLALSSMESLHSNESLKSTIRGCIEECLQSWSLALPRTMTSNDDSSKINLLERITSAVEYFTYENSAMSSSIEMLLSSIRDIAVFTTDTTTAKLIQPSQSLQLTFQEPHSLSTGISLQYAKDDKVAKSLEKLLHAIGRTTISTQVIDDLLIDASVDSPRSVSNAWIALHIIRGCANPEEQLTELYSLATDWLRQSDSSYTATEIPTSTIMTSLDILAFTASTRQLTFRESLIDVLYPTLSLLSHASPQVQAAARQTLERIAQQTGYGDISTLILENTDYLVNSVALKLNVFDVSVQVLATLYTVTRLAGPRIVPYMDDIWGSLFDVVDRFHGYEKLVTGVFAVMTGMVDVVSQSIVFPPTTSHETNETTHDTVCKGIQELIETIQKNEDHLPPKHTTVAIPKPSPLPAKTASLLQTLARKSVLLTTHPSPHLRFNLIHLLRKSLSALSIPTIVKDGEQDPFLPLLAQEVWPAVCSRLTDKEPWVVNAALETIVDLLALEGEFLGPKVEKDVWPALRDILSPKPQRGKGKNEVILYEREAALKAMVAIAMHTHQKPVVFDDMLEVTWPWIERGGEQGDELCKAFEMKNADAVWLKKKVDPGKIPEVPGRKGFFRPVLYQ
jgi:TELO2-interacting protein 1